MRHISQIFNPLFSPAEELALKGFSKYGLKPERNFEVGPYLIDFAFPDRKVGIEINSVKYHTDRARDVRRWHYLQSKGWKMYFFMAKQIMLNNYLAGAYIYYKEFHKDSTLFKQAKYDILMSFRHTLSVEDLAYNLDKLL